MSVRDRTPWRSGGDVRACAGTPRAQLRQASPRGRLAQLPRTLPRERAQLPPGVRARNPGDHTEPDVRRAPFVRQRNSAQRTRVLSVMASLVTGTTAGQHPAPRVATVRAQHGDGRLPGISREPLTATALTRRTHKGIHGRTDDGGAYNLLWTQQQASARASYGMSGGISRYMMSLVRVTGIVCVTEAESLSMGRSPT